MKTALTSGVTFAPGAKTLDFSGVSGFDKRRLLAVLHQPSGRTLYAAGTPALAGSFMGSVLTLAGDLTGLGAADPLTVLYEGAAADTGLATAAGQGQALAALQGIGTQLGGALQVTWGSRLPVDIGSASVTITGPVTVANEVEIKNDAGSPVPTADAGLGTDGASPPAIAGTGVRGWLRAIRDLLAGTLTVSGSAAVGSAPVNPPLSVSGVDGGGLKRHLLTDAGGALQMRGLNGVSINQTYVATAAFVSGNTAGTGGTNVTIVQALAANPGRAFIEIINNGTADAELWFGSRPADATVGMTPRQGVVIAAGGGGRVYDARVPLGAIYVTTSAAGGLSVLEG